MTVEKYKAGDRVLVDGAQVATILSYSEGANLFTYEVGLAGGGSNTVYAHISNTRIEDLPPQSDALIAASDAELLAASAAEQDRQNEKVRAAEQGHSSPAKPVAGKLTKS
jgi:hypothetical protein